MYVMYGRWHTAMLRRGGFSVKWYFRAPVDGYGRGHRFFA